MQGGTAVYCVAEWNYWSPGDRTMARRKKTHQPDPPDQTPQHKTQHQLTDVNALMPLLLSDNNNTHVVPPKDQPWAPVLGYA